MPAINDFASALERVLNYEGGFTDDPDDPGGATNLGIVQTEYDRYRSRKGLSKQSVRHITREEAAEIYEKEYWVASRAAYLNDPLAYVVFDTAVNFGVGRSNDFLNQAFGYPSSTVWNDKVSGRIHNVDQARIALAMIGMRMEYRGRRVLQNATQVKFLKGWLNRDRDLLNVVLKKSFDPPVPPAREDLT